MKRVHHTLPIGRKHPWAMGGRSSEVGIQRSHDRMKGKELFNKVETEGKVSFLKKGTEIF
ncbi:Uncharacterized protein TCM_034305 [Theobroma cacao]|uniref:Uncharacterized protein n=1 Tax=Theobroma cacao TaxID=3641 RepID=A0A061FE13_THECC|nr:Uncharacterized protein TCM_034305 [Theobroma cacao]